MNPYMLINFSISNFLSYNEQQTLSMQATKIRKHNERLHICNQTVNNIKLTKCCTIYGANASGKSNLVSSLEFAREFIVKEFPSGFSNKYFRLDDNKDIPSTFSFDLLISERLYKYQFSILLSRNILLYEKLALQNRDVTTSIFERDLKNEVFSVGNYFKNPSSIEKLNMYGNDSIYDKLTLFLTIINRSNAKMFSENPELVILYNIYDWFNNKLKIRDPSLLSSDKPIFTDDNLPLISRIMQSLGTGITNISLVDVSDENVKTRLPEPFYNSIIDDLHKCNSIELSKATYTAPTITASSSSDYYMFEIDRNNEIHIRTIVFQHENNLTDFALTEESDGTMRILNLLEILLDNDDCTFVIDELDRSLHPKLTTEFIKMYLTLAQNRNTQLILTGHESRIVAEDLLRNDEINFIIKKNQGCSIINPIDQFNLRSDKSTYKALFDGDIKEILPKINSTEVEISINYNSRL